MFTRIKHLIHVNALRHGAHVGEPWLHALYCAVLAVEGHGLYAIVGGVLGVCVFLNIVLNGE